MCGRIVRRSLLLIVMFACFSMFLLVGLKAIARMTFLKRGMRVGSSPTAAHSFVVRLNFRSMQGRCLSLLWNDTFTFTSPVRMPSFVMRVLAVWPLTPVSFWILSATWVSPALRRYVLMLFSSRVVMVCLAPFV